MSENTAHDGRTASGRGCPGCGAAVADAGLCATCTGRFLGDLRAVPWLANELEVLRAKLARMGIDTGLGGSAEIPLGYRPHAAEVADVLHLTLAVWARNVAEAHRLPLLDVPAETPARLAVWLIHWSEAARHLPSIAQMIDEIGYAVRLTRRTIDRPADRVYLGPCDECDEDIYAGAHAAQIACMSCGRAYIVDERRAWLLAGLREHLATAGEIAAGLGDMYGIQVNRKTINQWFHRERLHEHGRTRDGWPLFKIGDVLALASGQAATPRRAAN